MASSTPNQPTAAPAPSLTPLLPLLPVAVRSGWAISPIPVNGAVSAPEWAGAGVLGIPRGKLMVKNDATYLYVALDLVQDTGNNAGTGDYFWFTVDVNNDKAITPKRDTNYGLYPGQPNKLGRQYYLGPSTWTGLLNEVSARKVAIGFGPSPNSPLPHRTWELRIPLAEIGVDLTASPTPPAVRFGLRVSSTTPAFTHDYPVNFHASFASLPRILLATAPSVVYPPALAGAVIGGVGLIPATKIDADGYATTDPGYFIHVVDAPFGGVMHLIGNRTTMQGLWAAGARRYRIMRRIGTAGAFAPIRQNWSNYRWTASTYVLESFGPDAADTYPLLDPSQDYSIDDLLLQWNSTTEPNGVHQFQAAFFKADMTPVATVAQTLTVMLDNAAPTVDIVDITHDGASVPACAIVNLGLNDGVRLQFTVHDPEGHLGSYHVAASYGDGQSASIPGGGDVYANNINPATPHKWSGVTNKTVPVAGEWVPPVTCAYQFGVAGYSRVTNGYSSGFLYSSDTRHVTLIKPGSPVPLRAAARVSSAFPLRGAGGAPERAAE
jgi:hypothetical protein